MHQPTHPCTCTHPTPPCTCTHPTPAPAPGHLHVGIALRKLGGLRGVLPSDWPREVAEGGVPIVEIEPLALVVFEDPREDLRVRVRVKVRVKG